MTYLHCMGRGVALFILIIGSIQPAHAQQVLGFPRTVVIDSIEYRAEIEPVKAGTEIKKVRHFRAPADGYLIFLAATNLSSRPVSREDIAGDCLLSLSLHQLVKGRTRPAYDSHRKAPGCDFDAVWLRLQPGESTHRWIEAIYPEYRPWDSLPDGKYIVTALIRPTSWQETPKEIYVGCVRLVRPNTPHSAGRAKPIASRPR